MVGKGKRLSGDIAVVRKVPYGKLWKKTKMLQCYARYADAFELSWPKQGGNTKAVP